jgi:hypothetical protein
MFVQLFFQDYLRGLREAKAFESSATPLRGTPGDPVTKLFTIDCP